MIIHKFKVKKKKEISFKTLINPLTYDVSVSTVLFFAISPLFCTVYTFRKGRHMRRFTGLSLIVVQQHSRHLLVASIGAAATRFTAVAAKGAFLSLS